MAVENLEPAFAALSRRPGGHVDDNELLQDKSKLIAFYLPQYHRIPENSKWWGPGFTEWTNVAAAKPNFAGHYQPHIPRDLGFYDLSHPDVMFEQAELAKNFGLHGFCFYYYWFSGRRILERPLDNFLNSDIDINYCLCWANENWTRAWDGKEKDVLLAQGYAEGDAGRFIASVLKFFHDKRYITVDGKPLLLVYRAKDIPEPLAWFSKWRRFVEDQGFPGLYIAVVDFYDISSPDEVGADALVEFPPHKFNGPQSVPNVVPDITNPQFTGNIVDYTKVIAHSLCRPVPPFKLYRGIMPGWDNTARRQHNPTIVINEHPELYCEWLYYLRAYTREYIDNRTDNFIFVNAWNEWGEGCHLEPDQKWGTQYLEQTLKSSYHANHELPIDDMREAVLRKVAERFLANNLPSDETREDAVVQLATELSSYRPVSNFAYKVAARLVKWPSIYGVAKVAYRWFRRIRG